MKSCPQCDYKLTKKALEICPECGFVLAESESKTLREDTAKLPEDAADQSAARLAEEKKRSTDSTVKPPSSNDDQDPSTAATMRLPDPYAATGPNEKTLLVDPMLTMPRPLSNPSRPSDSTTKPPSTGKHPTVGPQDKTLIGQQPLPTVVNPQAAFEAAEAFSQGLKSLIPPRTMVRKEEAAEHSDYQIMKRIGAGAYGVVYRAKQVPLGRPVAVKLLQGSTDNQEHQQRIKSEFLREAQFTGRLEHPNIVPIHDIGLTVSAEGKVNPFYVMKEIRGQSWQGEIRNNSLKENLEIFKNVVNAIGFAHSQNILHCDLKPDNVMLGEFGEVLVVDWGQSVDLSVTETMRPGGTPAYISPEMAQYWIDIYLDQKRNSSSQAKVGFRSDVYLLGALLFETIAGTPPHCKDTHEAPYEVIRKAAKNQIVDYDDDVDKDLMNIALRALRATDEDHIETTEDLLAAIDQYEKRSLSIQLRRRADEFLERAKSEADYDDFQRARFSFEEAIEKWEGNEEARKGLRNSKLSCAEQALGDQNFDLGLDVLEGTEGDEETTLRKLLTEGKQARDRRKRLVAGLAIGLAGSILLGILINGYMINENVKSLTARDVAVAETKRAEEEKQKAEEEKLSAENDTKKAEENTKKIKDSIEPMRLQQVKMQAEIDKFPAKLKAENKKFDLKVAEQEANFKAQEDKLIREQADLQKKMQAEVDALDLATETLANEKQNLLGQVVDLNESSKLLRYKSGLTQISSELQSGDYREARRGLDQYQNQKDWEISRLNLLAHREIKSLYPQEPINAVSASADGQRLAVAFSDRVEIRRLDQLDRATNTINVGNQSAVALSPDGKQLFAAKPGDSQLAPGKISVFDLTQAEQTEPNREFDAQSTSIDHIQFSETGSALLSVGKASAIRQSSGQGLEKPLMVWVDGQPVNVSLVLPNGSKPKFDSASFSSDGKRILLTNQSGLPRDQVAYVLERSSTGYRWIASSPVRGISAATFIDSPSNDVVAGVQNANTGSYSLVRWRYAASSTTTVGSSQKLASMANIAPLESKAIQLEQQGNFVIATESDRQTTILDWRNKNSIKLQGQSRSANFCFIKSAESLESCKVVTAATGDKPELLSIDLSEYRPEYQRKSVGWSPDDRPASVIALFSPSETDSSLRAFGNDHGMASVIRNGNTVQWNISAWQYQIACEDFVFARSAEDYLYRYDRSTGALNRVLTKLARELNGRERITDLQVSDDGRVALVLTNSKLPKFLVWDLQQDRLIRKVNYGSQNLFGTGTQKQLPKLALSRDGKWVIGAKVGVFGWPVDSGQLVRFSNSDASAARSIANSIVFVRNSQQLLVSWRNRIVQFDLASQRQVASHSLQKVSDAQGQDNLLDAFKDGQEIRILAAENNAGGGILLLSLNDQKQLARFKQASFAAFASTKDGMSVIAGGLDEERKIRLETLSPSESMPKQIDLSPLAKQTLARHINGFERVSWSPQHGILLQTTERNRGSARRIWNSFSIDVDRNQKSTGSASLGKLRIFSKPSIEQIVAQDKRAATLANGQVLFWKLSDRAVKPDGVLDVSASTMQLAPDSKMLAVATDDNRCLLYDFAAGKTLGTFDLKDADGDVTAIAWQADSKAIAIGRATGEIEVVELNQDKLGDSDSVKLKLNAPINTAISQLAYSHDGTLLATVAEQGMAVLIRAKDTEAANLQDESDTGLSETIFRHSDKQTVLAADISADGNRVVSGSNTGRITIWNSQPHDEQASDDVRFASDERELLHLPNLHQSPITQVRFVDGPDGQTIVSAEKNSGKNEIISWPSAKTAIANDSTLQSD